MGNCCYCCLSEDDKVKLLMEKFPAKGCSQATDGMIEKLVGVCAPAGNVYYSPGGAKVCVYYKTVVEAEYHCIDYSTDQNGNQHRRDWNEWQTIHTEEQYSDFYLIDGNVKIFIKGSDRSRMKIQSVEDNTPYPFRFEMMPPGIRACIAMKAPNVLGGFSSGFGARGGADRRYPTGNFRYMEKCFQMNEKIACFGLVTPAVDPYYNQPIKMLMEYAPSVLNEQYFAANKWDDHSIEAWKEFARTPCVLLSDSVQFTQGIQIQPWTPPQPLMAPNWDAQFQAGYQSNGFRPT